ncbi:hypothetical protein CVT24_012447 [Panaeolus cyanescens]|uniref:HTH CENPB-type domain-containing protein n=1 Tax=Panaeolus cyanescens TaxID=181874 RepID=A0A409YZ05_9AGAR|nr:hypothetical protein CVT24_012447 [Panaeolus cyanescens]
MGGMKTRQEAHEHERLLSSPEEEMLVDWIKSLGRRAVPATLDMVRDFASEISGKKVGVNWPRKFMERHPDLKIKKTTQLEACRAQSLNCKAVTEFFDMLKDIIESNFLEYYHCARTEAFLPSTILSAFAKLGIWPLNPAAIPEKAFEPSKETSSRAAMPVSVTLAPLLKVVHPDADLSPLSQGPFTISDPSAAALTPTPPPSSISPSAHLPLSPVPPVPLSATSNTSDSTSTSSFRYRPAGLPKELPPTASRDALRSQITILRQMLYAAKEQIERDHAQKTYSSSMPRHMTSDEMLDYLAQTEWTAQWKALLKAAAPKLKELKKEVEEIEKKAVVDAKWAEAEKKRLERESERLRKEEERKLERERKAQLRKEQAEKKAAALRGGKRGYKAKQTDLTSESGSDAKSELSDFNSDGIPIAAAEVAERPRPRPRPLRPSAQAASAVATLDLPVSASPAFPSIIDTSTIAHRYPQRSRKK